MIHEPFTHIAGGRTLSICTPEEKDAESMIRHVQTLLTETDFLARDPGTFDISPEKERALIQGWRDSPVVCFLIAKDGDTCVGTCSLVGSEKRRHAHQAEFGVGIQKAYWGGHLGESMMRACIDWAKEAGIWRLALTCSANNQRAVGLYRKLGFQVEGRLLCDQCLMDGSYDDSYQMALLLPHRGNEEVSHPGGTI